jgi:hypothetical protein
MAKKLLVSNKVTLIFLPIAMKHKMINSTCVENMAYELSRISL